MTPTTTSDTIQRQSVEYKPTYQRFVLKQKSYNQQFSHVYVNRLQQLRAVVTQRVQDDAAVRHVRVLPKIIDLRDGDTCVVIGTILKVLPRKPNLFDALLSEDGVAPIEALTAPLASVDDQLILEDESGRVELVSSNTTDLSQLVTGVVLGVCGAMDSKSNAFNVTHVVLPSLPPQPPLPTRDTSAYVALVSGLSLGRLSSGVDNPAATPLRHHVLIDYLAGRLGDAAERQFVAQIVRTIVVGNSVDVRDAPAASTTTATTTKKSVEALALDAEPMKNLDELLASLACASCVDVLPGPTDPSNYTLPQQSFHACLFPRAAQFASFRAVTNPYAAEIGGVSFFGHAGQPLASVLQCTLAPEGLDDEAEDQRTLQSLANCLEWRHVAPTAPDLVACFPLADDDPFILDASPHVLFAGNQKRFASKLVTGTNNEQVRVISVPSFAETATIVLVDLKDLSCFPITIAA